MAAAGGAPSPVLGIFTGPQRCWREKRCRGKGAGEPVVGIRGGGGGCGDEGQWADDIVIC